MTIFRTLLSKGYFPKELPPSFFTSQYASYAVTRTGRNTLLNYSPADRYTDCVDYRLAVPGHDRRLLRIPHPAAFARLAALTAKHFQRMLKKTHRSQFSKSKPVYEPSLHRALHPQFVPGSLTRERSASRAGASFVLKADVSQFYPSLYTHAVGWALDAKLRLRVNWGNMRLLGKKIDQALMDQQAKLSQGIPIGNDISYLLGEIVLAQVDRALKVSPERSYRWFDDYEFACDSREQAERLLANLTKTLNSFRLRTNPAKTQILPLPSPVEEEWRDQIIERGKGRLKTAQDMVGYFDLAFRVRDKYPTSPVLTYALGILFRLRRPSAEIGRVAESSITQALFTEPGAAQKAFALLTFWSLNGYRLNDRLLSDSIGKVVVRHAAGGVSSDVCWALSFAIEQGLPLNRKAAKTLSAFDDDCVALQSLHMDSLHLLPGFANRYIAKELARADLDGPHWLLAYESVRHGFLAASAPAVNAHPVFSDLLAKRITFYRTQLPSYAALLHPGGAPEWMVREWLKSFMAEGDERAQLMERIPALEPLATHIAGLEARARSRDELIIDLLDVLEPKEFAEALHAEQPYWG